MVAMYNQYALQFNAGLKT